MDDLLHATGLPGYRLHKVQIMNWGTFDSKKGQIHTVRPTGRTSLLIGQNGSGKSTMVDSVLTLLVRPGIRNYNVAAGSTGKKKERDERSYLLGAYGHASSDSENKAATLYLRKDARHLSVLLGYFYNEATRKGFTVSQVLYLGAENKVEKIFCFAQGEKDIAADFADIKSVDKIAPKLESRGFRTSRTYAQYHKWLIAETNMRPKAMDVFNQTVAVKDIRSLTEFIRSHMLEGANWGERIEHILSHFTQLSDAHRMLVEAREQIDALHPVAQKGSEYQSLRRELDKREGIERACDSFFRVKTVSLFSARREERLRESQHVQLELNQLGSQLDSTEEQLRRLQNDLENSGGERMRSLPYLIQQKEEESRHRRNRSERYHDALRRAGVETAVTDEESFHMAAHRLRSLNDQTSDELQRIEDQKLESALQARNLEKQREAQEAEIAALTNRGSKLPEAYELMRSRICESLQTDPRNLPYAAELIAVKPGEEAWESAIESVLRTFGLSLLVPSQIYGNASAVIDRSMLVDASGEGQRLIYHRIPENPMVSSSPIESLAGDSILRKLDFQEHHPLAGWVKAELEQRYNFHCCHSLEEFQQHRVMALTQDRHVKLNCDRHEKDDRETFTDPRHHILGWTNEGKVRILQADLNRTFAELEQALVRKDQLTCAAKELRNRQAAIKEALERKGFAEMNFAPLDAEISALLREKEQLEASDESVRAIATQLDGAKAQKAQLKEKEAQLIKRMGVLERELAQANELIENANRQLNQTKAEGDYSHHETQFLSIEADVFNMGGDLSADTLFERSASYTSELRKAINKIRERLEPLEKSLLQSMSRFLRKFRQFEQDLKDDPAYLDDFIALHDRLKNEDLPKHEQSFKERLNEKVTTEIGILNNQLNNEREEILTRIETLNKCLETIDYDPLHGSYMQLEPKPVRDRELDEFQHLLKDCLSGAFEGTFEADEARFKQIEALIAKLQDDPRWREKVTDVRRWFDFGARETVRGTGEERGYYSDSAGQSGGEKAKLAFTILVAAVVYQFDIDPEQSASDRFHFVVIDEMFSKIDDTYAEYALKLFEKFGLQLLIVAPFDAKAKITEPYVDYYIQVVKKQNRSRVLTMTSGEFQERCNGGGSPAPMPESRNEFPAERYDYSSSTELPS